MTQATSSPVEGRRQAAAHRIELTALRLLAEQGVEAVTVQDVAKAAGISRRTFYRYFDSIEELCLAAPRRALHRLAGDIRARPLSEPVSEAFLNASRAKQVSEDELTLQRLGMAIYLRDRDPWMRIMALLDADTAEILSGVIAERLGQMGGDTAMAQLLAKVIICVIHEVPPAFDRPVGGDSTIDALRDRLVRLASLLAPNEGN